MKYAENHLVCALVLFFFLIGTFCTQEDIVTVPQKVAWLKEKAMPLKSIDPQDEDFSDLAPFRKIIRKANVVLLGEQSHGDGSTFHAKIRLIKYLHQECGFDVIAFESGLYDCHKAWQQVQEGIPGEQAVENSVFAIWTKSREFFPLAEYIGQAARSSNPLEIAGFDCQFTSTNSRNFFLADLKSFLVDIEVDTAAIDGWDQFGTVVGKLLSGAYRSKAPEASEEAEFNAVLDRIKNRIPERNSKRCRFWRQVLISLKSEAEGTFHIGRIGMKNMSMKDTQARDLQMGENIVWLSREYYPTRKIIVWAASRHNAYHLNDVDTQSETFTYEGFVNMGDVVQQGLEDDAYNLGFTAYEGSAGPWFREAFTLPKPTAESLEDLFHQTDLENAILDFSRIRKSGRWLNEIITARPFGYSEMKAVWPEIFDGMCYTRVMIPSTKRQDTQ